MPSGVKIFTGLKSPIGDSDMGAWSGKCKRSKTAPTKTRLLSMANLAPDARRRLPRGRNRATLKKRHGAAARHHMIAQEAPFMMKLERVTPASGDGFTKFQVRAGIRLISCAVADEALEAVAGLVLPSTASTRRKSFDRYRTLIDAAAKLKLGNLADEFRGLLVVSSGDLRLVPAQSGLPRYGGDRRRP